MKYFEHLRHILRHKWLVFRECWKEGLYLQGIIHDTSKFFPSEFVPYSKYRKSDSTEGGKKAGAGEPEFELAVLLHRRRNRHHWQYWVFIKEDTYFALPMPLKYRREMICDWLAYHGGSIGETSEWYRKNQRKIHFHPETKKWVEEKLRTV